MHDLFIEVYLKKITAKLEMKILTALTFLAVLAFAYGIGAPAIIGAYGGLTAPLTYGGLGYYGAGLAAPIAAPIAAPYAASIASPYAASIASPYAASIAAPIAAPYAASIAAPIAYRGYGIGYNGLGLGYGGLLVKK